VQQQRQVPKQQRKNEQRRDQQPERREVCSFSVSLKITVVQKTFKFEEGEATTNVLTGRLTTFGKYIGLE